VGTGTGGFCLSVDIGGTKTRVRLVDADHRVLDVREAAMPARDDPVVGVGPGQYRPSPLTAGGVPRHSAARGLT
jgi:hypothetical protein